MCSAPDVKEPQQYQEAQTAEYSDEQRKKRGTTGRGGTILAGGSAPIVPAAGGTGKTLLGQ